MAKTIDNTVKSLDKYLKKEKKSSNSKNYVSKIDKSQSKLEKIVNKAIDVGLIALAAKYYLTSTLLSFAGFSIADLILKKKEKGKITVNQFAKSLFNGAADAAINGPVQEEMYKGIEKMPNKTLLQKFVKTLTFNPGIIGPYLGYFLGTQYLRYDIGYLKAIKGILNPRFGNALLKDFYHTKIKGQYWPKLWKIFKQVFPIHFFSINYLSPEKFGATYLPLRMGLASGNDVILALAAKPDKKDVKDKKLESKISSSRNNYQFPRYNNNYHLGNYGNSYKKAA